MWRKRLITLIPVILAGCNSSEDGAPPRSPAFAPYVASAKAESTRAEIRGYRANFTLVRGSADIRLTDAINGAVTSFPLQTATVEFVDQHVSFDVDGLPGRTYRLYQAAFDRVPDASGLGFWINAAQQGATLSSISGEFIRSPEFRARYGAQPTAEQFVSALYANVLHRPPEQAGYDWWVDTVKKGADWPSVLISFAESAENKAALQSTLDAGFAYIPYRPNAARIPLPSSYENKMAPEMGPQPIPRLPNGEIIGPAVAYADFFGDGSYSMVGYSADFSTTDTHGHTTGRGKAYFFRKENDQWIDRTSQLLEDPTGCFGARKLIVADFNGDGRPDVFAACHGYDGPPYPGENQRMLLSQADGKYRNVDTGILCFCHGASAAVLDRPGYADILVADQMVDRIPYFLINNRNGTFSKDKSRLPANLEYKQIWTAELIDFSGRGKYDAFLAGMDPQGDGYQIPPTIFVNDGANHFHGLTHNVPLLDAGVPSAHRGTTLDVLFHKQSIYLLRTFNYESMAIQKTAFPSMASTQIYSHTGSYAPSQQYGQGWFAWIRAHRGKIISDVADVIIDE